MSFLGIDIGTTGCKALVFDKSGGVLTSAYKEYSTISPQSGWFELDSQRVIADCKEVVAKCANQVSRTDPVVSLAVSSQGEAFTILDSNNKYLCNAMVSFDVRSQKQVEQFTESFGLEKLYKITGHSPHTLFSVFKIIWLRENRPEIFGKIGKLLCFGDLFSYELTGNCAIGYNLAARTMLFDVSKLDWSDKILQAIGLDRGVLPKPIPSGAEVGRIRKEIAEQLGLNKDVVVAAGGHDQSCGALGAAVCSSGVAAYATGTVECITPVFDKLILDKKMRDGNLATYPAVIEGLYTTVAFNLTGGNLLKWFRDQLSKYEVEKAKLQNCDAYDLILKDIPDEPTSLFVQPHFASTGTPYFNPNPTGAIIGLSLNTTKLQIAKAILEGVTYEMKLNIELLKSSGIEVNELRAIGGGAKSEKWMQIKSDIMGVPIVALNISETGCLGAALLGAKAAGYCNNLGEMAGEWVKTARTYEPSRKKTEKYKKRFEIYTKIYDNLKPLGDMINKL